LDNTVTVIDDYTSTVQEFMVIGAQAEHVSLDVGAIVWPAKGLDVGSLRIRARGAIEAGATNLAGVVILLLKSLG